MPEQQPGREKGTLFRPEALEAARSKLGAPGGQIGLGSWSVTIFLLVVLVTTAVYLCFARYTRKTTIMGTLQPTLGIIRVVATKPGTISSVYVNEGDTIRVNEPLIAVDQDTVTARGVSLGRLEEAATTSEQHAISSQMAAQRRSSDQQRAEINAKISGLKAAITSSQEALSLAERRLHLEQASADTFRALNASKVVSDLQYRDREDAVIQMRQNIVALEKEQNDDNAEIAQLTAQRDRLSSDLHLSLAESDAALAQLQGKAAGNEADRRIILTAPQSGRVVSLPAKAGESIASAAALAVILPERSSLEAELWAPSKAAGFIRPGEKVRLLYDAFPYQRFGAAFGTVQRIANAATSPTEIPGSIDSKEASYRVDVALDQQYARGYGRKWALQPGTRLSADIVLDHSSFIEWLLDPLLSVSRRAGG